LAVVDVAPSVVGDALVVGVDAGVVVELDATVDDGALVVVVRLALSTLPGKELGSTNEPTSVPSVIAFMYLFQMVAGNVPPKTTRPCTLFMNFGGWPGALS
jgi:hypothetical protein